MQLWLIRHGQTDWNLEGRWQGQSPAAPSLNTAGRAQAEAIAGELALSGVAFAALHTSDLARARETADFIAARLNLRARLDERLREIALGRWEGLTPIEISKRFPNEWLADRIDPTQHSSHGGESWQHAQARIVATANDLARAHRHQPVLVVTHGFVSALLICHANGAPLERAREFIPKNAHPTKLRIENSGMSVDEPDSPSDAGRE